MTDMDDGFEPEALAAMRRMVREELDRARGINMREADERIAASKAEIDGKIADLRASLPKFLGNLLRWGRQ